MARQKGSKGNITEKKYCPKCKKDKPITKFYQSTSTLFPDGLCNICSDCFVEDINCSKIESVQDGLMKLNLPFYFDKWQKDYEKNGDSTFRKYVTQMNSLPQYKNKKWKDSRFGNDSPNISKPNINYNLDFDFEITPEMIQRWGSKHECEDYIKLEQFYHQMKTANKIETPQDENYLKKLAVISVKMDRELEEGNYDEVKKLGDLFSKYMADSQFRAMDKTDADKTGGIRRFCDIYVEVEKDGFIPPWEYYRKIKGIKQDIVDKTIMHIENFTLKLNKIEQMVTSPIDTPKLEENEIDKVNSININDIAVDSDFSVSDGDDNNGIS